MLLRLFPILFCVCCAVLVANAQTDDESKSPWPEGVGVVSIPSTIDGAAQSAYFHGADAMAPLVVSLHTWSGNYAQEDPLAPLAVEAGWNYIHPDFRGPNRTPDACMSEKAIADIDDAIAYALEHGAVDMSNIFVVGVSGGGYATTGMYLKSRHPVKAFLAWASITDVRAWYYQSVARQARYADDILAATSSGEALKEDEALRRSPMAWELPEQPRQRLELYAGIHDGYEGSVPISHSLLFYNRLVEAYGPEDGAVSGWDIATLLSRGAKATGDKIGDRAVYLHRETPYASITVFEGGHEMLVEACFARLRELAKH